MERFGLVGILVLVSVLAAAGCSDDSSGSAGDGGGGGQGGTGGEGGTGGGAPVATVSMGGIAWGFTLPEAGDYDLIAGATISVLEAPELSTTTNEQGEFTIEGVPVGSEATFVLEHENYPLTYTKTHTVPDTGLADLTFQVPNNVLFRLIEAGLIEGGIVEGVNPDKCQIVSTFTRYGKTIGDPGAHGEPGALLSVSPANNAEYGPMYFNDMVRPDPSRTYSSIDGGVLLVNVDPGDYTLSASCVEIGSDLHDDFLAEYPSDDPQLANESLRCQDEDVQFEPVLMKCRAGVFLNASPSYGLQALPPTE